MNQPTFRTQTVGDVEVFYREAGPSDVRVVLLLHGFPAASHMFRDQIPALSDRYRLIAPDLPGFGNTKAPDRNSFAYSFDSLAEVIAGFVQTLHLDRFALYIFDYGAPVGLRLALRFPQRIAAIISQNGNAYMEGFSDAWGPWQTYWRDPSAENREACRISLTPDTIREWQYFNGADRGRVSPDGYTLDIAYTTRRQGNPARPDPGLPQQSRILP
jgi:pimeloyl-ACP methyl ester carboxylesterase